MSEHTLAETPRLPVLRPNERRRRVVFVASPNADSLEMIGPLNVLRAANSVLEDLDPARLGYDIEVVTSQPGAVYQVEGLTIAANRPFHRLRGPVDTLLFAPMKFEDLFDRKDGFLPWVNRMSARVRRVGTICFATYILAEAGVLDGRRATTHWELQDHFRGRYPDITLEPEPIYVKDGNTYTSAGATAGVDMTIALLEEDFGHDVALRVAQSLVLYLKRPGNQAQFSVQLSTRLPEDRRLADLQSFIYENLDQDLRVEALAARAGMSPRNFSRIFTRQVGMTPGRFTEQCRLEVARQWLEESHSRLSEVAERCGYGTAAGMRIAFERNLGVSPRAYRQRFSTARES